MSDEKKLGTTTVRVETRDITDFEVDAFVFYAVPDLTLGTGYGTAIQARGGPDVRKELEGLGPVALGEAVVSTAGNMRAKHIIHAVGPQFVEEEREEKLRRTMRSALRCAEEKGVKTLAFPPMGAGFYMIPPELCSSIMLETIGAHVANGTGIEEITICVLDSTQQSTFKAALAAV
jgi:O-acetyl-ADP-ribose deacetylase (regulator of RNase III)